MEMISSDPLINNMNKSIKRQVVGGGISKQSAIMILFTVFSIFALYKLWF